MLQDLLETEVVDGWTEDAVDEVEEEELHTGELDPYDVLVDDQLTGDR